MLVHRKVTVWLRWVHCFPACKSHTIGSICRAFTFLELSKMLSSEFSTSAAKRRLWLSYQERQKLVIWPSDALSYHSSNPLWVFCWLGWGPWCESVRWAFEDTCWLWWSSRFRCRLKLGHPVSWDWQTWIRSAGAIFEEEGAESPVASQVGKAWWWEGDPDEGRINGWHLEIRKLLVFQGEIPVSIQLALQFCTPSIWFRMQLSHSSELSGKLVAFFKT